MNLMENYLYSACGLWSSAADVAYLLWFSCNWALWRDNFEFTSSIFDI